MQFKHLIIFSFLIALLTCSQSSNNDTNQSVKVQRNFSGSFTVKPNSFSKTTATISGDNIPDSAPRMVDLWYNEQSLSYNGYAYFDFTEQTLNYSVYTKVYDKDTVFIGHSPAVAFTSAASNIIIPAFNPNNAIPVTDAGKDTTVSIYDTIRLHATAVDSFGGTIVKWEWSINGGTFVKTSTGDTAIIAPKDSNPSYICKVRATDNDGNIAMDSMKVVVCQDVPVIDAGPSVTAYKFQSISFQGSCTQQFGRIVMYKWDFEGDGIFDDSSDVNKAVSHSYDNKAGIFNAVYYVRDDDGNEATATRKIIVLSKIPECTITSPINNTTFYITDTIPITISASDTDGTIAMVKVFIDDSLVATLTQAPYQFYGASPKKTGKTMHTIKAVAVDSDSSEKAHEISFTSTRLQVVDSVDGQILDIDSTRICYVSSDLMQLILKNKLTGQIYYYTTNFTQKNTNATLTKNGVIVSNYGNSAWGILYEFDNTLSIVKYNGCVVDYKVCGDFLVWSNDGNNTNIGQYAHLYLRQLSNGSEVFVDSILSKYINIWAPIRLTFDINQSGILVYEKRKEIYRYNNGNSVKIIWNPNFQYDFPTCYGKSVIYHFYHPNSQREGIDGLDSSGGSFSVFPAINANNGIRNLQQNNDWISWYYGFSDYSLWLMSPSGETKMVFDNTSSSSGLSKITLFSNGFLCFVDGRFNSYVSSQNMPLVKINNESTHVEKFWYLGNKYYAGSAKYIYNIYLDDFSK